MLACWLRHVGTYLAAESTALKRPSNGDPEMKADRVCRAGLPVKICWLFFLFSTLFWSGTMSLGRGEEERGAGVSRSECEQCGLVRGWGPVSKAIPGLCTVCNVCCCRLLQGPDAYRLPKLRPIHQPWGISRSQPLRQASGRRRPKWPIGEVGLRGKIYIVACWT